MAGLLEPVIFQLIANTAEFQASLDESMASLKELAGVSETTAAKVDASGAGIGAGATKGATLFAGGVKKMTTAVIGAGVAFAAFGIDKAVKLQDAYDNLTNTTNVTAGELANIKTATISLSDATGQSAINIVGGWQTAIAAGYKFRAAQEAVTAATKLTVIVGGDLVTNLKSLVAAQDLGITKGMSAAKVADLFTIATKGNVNGIGSVVSLLQGKAGSAFAAYGQSAGEAVTIANALSVANYTNARALETFVGAVGTLHSKLIDFSVTNGKVSKSSAAWVDKLLTAGLNVDKVKTAISGPDGLVNGLKYLQTVAHGSLSTLNTDLLAVFGTQGPALGQLILKYINQHPGAITAANASSAGGLNTAFTTAANQFGNQLKIVWANFTNDAAGFGEALLPGLEKVLGYVGGKLKALGQNPTEQKEIFAALGTAFAAAVGIKLLTFVNTIRTAINSTTQTTLLADIARNTALTATREGVVAGEGGGGSAVGTFGKSVLVFGAGVLAFEAASKFLDTKDGKKVGNFIVDHNLFGIGTLSNITADLFHKRVYGDLGAGQNKGDEQYLKSIGEWGNYLKLIEADSTANYTEVRKLSAIIQSRENQNKPKGRTSVTIHLGAA